MPKVCDSQQRYCVYRRGDSIDFRFSADLLSQHLEEKISVGDKRPRSSFFSSISLPFHLTPRPYQSTTVLTVPAEAKANLSPISLRGSALPFHTFPY